MKSLAPKKLWPAKFVHIHPNLYKQVCTVVERQERKKVNIFLFFIKLYTVIEVVSSFNEKCWEGSYFFPLLFIFAGVKFKWLWSWNLGGPYVLILGV